MNYRRKGAARGHQEKKGGRGQRGRMEEQMELFSNQDNVMAEAFVVHS